MSSALFLTLHNVLTHSKPAILNLTNAWRQPLFWRAGCVNQTFLSHPLPTQTWQHDTCSLTDEGMKYSLPANSYVSTSTHLYSSLLMCSQPQSSWPVICDLPVWGCNKVSTQLRIHFPGTSTTNHRPESPDTHTNTHKRCLCHTNQALHKWQHEITNHCSRRKGNY